MLEGVFQRSNPSLPPRYTASANPGYNFPAPPGAVARASHSQEKTTTLWTRLLAVSALALAAAGPAAAAPVEKGKPIDLVLCLDVSNSMDGLIASAKIRLWAVVNELATVKPTPELRVALYSYGHNNYPSDKGWVRKDLDLSTDLDAVYAKLNALQTGGGTEYVGRVTKTALDDLKWCDDAKALKVIFVCGNEAADQDKEVNLADLAAAARKRDVIVNTIYCGSGGDSISVGWRDFATAANGSYANIDQNKASREVAVATPYDKDMAELSGKLNTTYVGYGAQRALKAENQAKQDANAGAAAPAAAAERASSKAGALYKNSDWCLVDKLKEDPKFDVKTMKDEDLPEEIKKLKPEERMPYLKKKLKERETLSKSIADLAGKRAKFIDEERKKTPKTDGEKALDDALKGMIREQAKAKGFEIGAAGK